MTRLNAKDKMCSQWLNKSLPSAYLNNDFIIYVRIGCPTWIEGTEAQTRARIVHDCLHFAGWANDMDFSLIKFVSVWHTTCGMRKFLSIIMPKPAVLTRSLIRRAQTRKRNVWAKYEMICILVAVLLLRRSIRKQVVFEWIKPNARHSH